MTESYWTSSAISASSHPCVSPIRVIFFGFDVTCAAFFIFALLHFVYRCAPVSPQHRILSAHLMEDLRDQSLIY